MSRWLETTSWYVVLKMEDTLLLGEKFYPTLFVPSKRKSKYKTLEGEYVESVEPGSVRDCREFNKKV